MRRQSKAATTAELSTSLIRLRATVNALDEMLAELGTPQPLGLAGSLRVDADVASTQALLQREIAALSVQRRSQQAEYDRERENVTAWSDREASARREGRDDLAALASFRLAAHLHNAGQLAGELTACEALGGEYRDVLAALETLAATQASGATSAPDRALPDRGATQ